MATFVPTSPSIVAALGALVAALLGSGWALGKLDPARWHARARAAAWLIALAATIAAERICGSQAPGVRMFGLIAVALVGLKAVVLVEARAAGMEALPPRWWLAFALGWPGMSPKPFAERARAAAEPRRENAPVVRAGGWLAGGVLLVVAARAAWTYTGSLVLVTVLILPGLSLALHFGVLGLLAAAWRAAGVNVRPLFQAPLLATSLGEFWGRRWNLAFSQMAAAVVYRPLVARHGRAAALMAAFVLSGLLHELAISVPVRAGLGWPLAYFTLQGALVLVEEALARHVEPGSRRTLVGRFWTLAWLAAPALLLFHPAFLRGVVWPLAGVPGSAP